MSPNRNSDRGKNSHRAAIDRLTNLTKQRLGLHDHIT